MKPVLFLARARAEIDDIWIYLAQYDLAVADKFVADLGEKVSRLSRFPLLGPARPEWGHRIRSLLLLPYILAYQVQPDAIHIVSVFRGERQRPPFLDLE